MDELAKAAEITAAAALATATCDTAVALEATVTAEQVRQRQAMQQATVDHSEALASAGSEPNAITSQHFSIEFAAYRLRLVHNLQLPLRQHSRTSK